MKMNAETTRPQEQGNTEDLPALDGEWEMKRLGDIADIDPENLPNNTDPDYEFNWRCCINSNFLQVGIAKRQAPS